MGSPITQDPPHPPILTLQAPPFTQSLDESKALPFPKDLPRLPLFRPSALFLPPDYKHPGGQRSYLRFSKPQPWAMYTVGTQSMFLRREWKEERIPGASPPSPQPGLGVGQLNLGTWGGAAIPLPRPHPSSTLLLHSWNLGRGFIPLRLACLSGLHWNRPPFWGVRSQRHQGQWKATAATPRPCGGC